MTDPFSFVDFIRRFQENGSLADPSDFDDLLSSLSFCEHPDSLRTFIWMLLKTFQRKPLLQAKFMEEWTPTEPMLAQLLEDIGTEAAPVLLSLSGGQKELQRLWKLCDMCEMGHQYSTSNPWVVISLSPMGALEAERGLDTLIKALTNGHKLKDPSTVLKPEDGFEVEWEPIVALGKSRIGEKGGGSEALNLTMIRLMRYVDSLPANEPPIKVH